MPLFKPIFLLTGVLLLCSCASTRSEMAHERYDDYESDDDVAEVVTTEETSSFAGDLVSGFFGGDGDADERGGARFATTDSNAPGKGATKAPPAPPSEPGETKAAPNPLKNRLVIYTANYAILVASSDVAISDFKASVKTLGGYLSQRSGTSVVVRVPAEHFQTLIDSLNEFGDITQQNVRSNDVTEAYRDQALRLENAKKARARLLVLLEKAEKTEDLLKIEREITRLSETIEVLEGKLRHLRDQVAFSTVSVNFYQNVPAPRNVNRRRSSRFEWINKVGVENVLQRH